MLNSTLLLIGAVAATLTGVTLSVLAWRHSARPRPVPAPAGSWIPTLEVIVVGLIAPALLFPTLTRVAVVALVPLIWMAAAWRGLGLVPRTPLTPQLWGLLALAAMSAGVTYDVVFSLGKIAGVVLGVLVFWAMVRWTDTAARLRLAYALFAVAGVALALIGLFGVEKYGSKVSVLGAIVERLPILIRGVPGAEAGFSPNPVAGCLALFLPLQLAMLVNRTLRAWMLAPLGPALARLAIAVQVLGLVLTAAATTLMQSRGTWLGLLLATGVWVLWRSRLLRRVTGAAVLLALLAVVWMGPTQTWSAVQAVTGPRLGADISVRLSLWSSGLRGIQDAPLTGHGMNTFRKIMMQRYAIPEITAHYHEVAHAHNNFIQAALDLGLGGLAVYISLWLSTAAMLVHTARRLASTPAAMASTALGFGLLAHFVFGLTDAIPLGAKVGVLFWMAMALVAATHAHLARTETNAPGHDDAVPDA